MDLAERVAARYLKGLAKKISTPPGIAGDLEAMGEEIEISRKRQRRQRGKARLESKRYYRRHRRKAIQRSRQRRRTKKTQIKRYEKRRRKRPQMHRRRRATAVIALGDIQFWDFEEGMPGAVQSVNTEEETIQTTLDGNPKEYDVFAFLDSAAVETEEDEGELLGVLDKMYDYDPAEDEEGEELLEEDLDWDELRTAKELGVVYMVHDVLPHQLSVRRDPDPDELIYRLTVEQFIKYVAKTGLARWNRDNATLHDDSSSARRDAKDRLKRFHHRFDINLHG